MIQNSFFFEQEKLAGTGALQGSRTYSTVESERRRGGPPGRTGGLTAGSTLKTFHSRFNEIRPTKHFRVAAHPTIKPGKI